jgi:hypothetical protein
MIAAEDQREWLGALHRIRASNLGQKRATLMAMHFQDHLNCHAMREIAAVATKNANGQKAAQAWPLFTFTILTVLLRFPKAAP